MYNKLDILKLKNKLKKNIDKEIIIIKSGRAGVTKTEYILCSVNEHIFTLKRKVNDRAFINESYNFNSIISKSIEIIINN